MRTNYVLIDYENVQTQSLHLLNDEHFKVIAFLGPTNTKLRVDFVLAMHKIAQRSSYITLETPGTNALDFHIAYYLGNLAITDPKGIFHIISRDTGFDPLIQHLKSRKISCSRSSSIEEIFCLTQISQAKHEDKVAPQAPSLTKQETLEGYLKIAIEDLINRKSSKPRTTKTLKSTIQAKIGKGISGEITDQVFSLLIKNGHAKINGEKVSYTLPTKN
ncbi:hypothetical protein KSF73_14225 [Burkholderiaceae bacterium DAT-1]|nr:hypothetical protein [Burkholderiaceae bacterium DAT-1]